MSNPIDIPLSNPEGLPLSDANQINHRKSSAVKRIFKNFTFARLFARKKATNMDSISIAEDPPASNNLEEMHEMQVLQSVRTLSTESEEPENIPIQGPEPQTVS